MKKYTVLVLRPYYITDCNPEDTYLAHVTAETSLLAEKRALDEAWRVDHDGPEVFDESMPELPDYAALAVFDGHLNDKLCA